MKTMAWKPKRVLLRGEQLAERQAEDDRSIDDSADTSHLGCSSFPSANRRARSRGRWLGALAAVAFSLCACSSETDEASHFDEATLKAGLESAQASSKIVGILAEVATPSGTIHARSGVAEVGTDEPVPWEGQFRVASTTKPFTAVVVLQLVAEAKLSLEDTVDKLLPGVVVGNGNDGSKITVRQLLQHTSGLFDYVMDSGLQKVIQEDFSRACHDTTSVERLVAYGMNNPPLFEPGAKWSYSNTNYLLLEMIVQKLTGQTWAVETKRRIIDPLGLAHTYVSGTDPKIPEPHAHSYIMIPEAPPLDTTECTSMHTADSAIVSTTADLITFFKALVGGELLRPEQLAAMQTTVEAPDPQFPEGRYGLGIQWTPLSCGGGYWHHAGDGLTGFYARTGVTSDGRRSIVISMSSTIDFLVTNPVTAALTDKALCDRRD